MMHPKTCVQNFNNEQCLVELLLELAHPEVQAVMSEEGKYCLTRVMNTPNIRGLLVAFGK